MQTRDSHNPVRHKDCVVIYGGKLLKTFFFNITYFKLVRCTHSCLNAFYEEKRHKIKESKLQGFKYFKAISGMLDSLHKAGCQRDRAGNRKLHLDQYISLLLLYMFNPICTPLRTVQQASELKRSNAN